MKKIFLAVIAMVFALGVNAQNATNSPYSQYGLGTLADQSNGANVAMGGTHIAWREGNQVNFGNAASYSALDSLTFIFDAGISGQVTNFQEGNVRRNANNSSVDYIIGAFRFCKHLGTAFGIMPFANVGYTFYNKSDIPNTSDGSQTNTSVVNTYAGNGGFRQLFWGIGYEPLRTKKTSLSVGVNVSYLWGNSTKSVINEYSDTYVKTLSKHYYTSMESYKLDLSAQLRQRAGDRSVVTFGAKFSPGHSVGGEQSCMIISNNSVNGVADTTTYSPNGRMTIPTSYGVGVYWNYMNRLKMGMDYSVEKWSSTKIPVYQLVAGKPEYEIAEGQFTDKKRISFGADYTRNQRSRHYLDHVHIRAGAYYTSPYLKVNGLEGPKEYGVTAGFGIPIVNTYNNRSMLNISAQWSHLEATGMIKENTFRINVGFTFNERWFAKWKLE